MTGTRLSGRERLEQVRGNLAGLKLARDDRLIPGPHRLASEALTDLDGCVLLTAEEAEWVTTMTALGSGWQHQSEKRRVLVLLAAEGNESGDSDKQLMEMKC